MAFVLAVDMICEQLQIGAPSVVKAYVPNANRGIRLAFAHGRSRAREVRRYDEDTTLRRDQNDDVI